MVTYHVVQCGGSKNHAVHHLVKCVKLLAVQLEIILEVSPPFQPLIEWIWSHLTDTLGIGLPLLWDSPVVSDESSWPAEDILQQTTIWLPSPHLAAQAMGQLASLWVASPWGTAAVVLVPCIFSRMWYKVNKYFHLVSVIKTTNTPASLPIIITTLHPYDASVQQVQGSGQDCPSPNVQWHKDQIKYMCGL
eukprot:99965-Ditylum_brightwellii.AAC.1